MEQVRLHRVGYPVGKRLAEAHAQSAADDHRLDIEQVDGRGDARAECGDRFLEYFLRQLVVMLERPLPDAAGQPGTSALLHQLEQLGLLALLRPLAGPGLHRGAARVGLEAPATPTRAPGTALLDDHMPDLARPAPAEPRLACENQAAADPSPPEHAEQRLVLTAGAQIELGVGGHLDVVADPDPRAQHRGERRRELEGA